MFSLSASPRISIIITTYNGAAYIGDTIRSVLAQTWTNWELLIVDDGSADNTCELITAFGDVRIRLYKAGRVGINGRIKNMALRYASGELLAFIDHDDLWAPQKLEKQVAALRQYPAAGFCLCGGYHFSKEDEPVNYFYQQREGHHFGNVFLTAFQSGLATWTQALLVHKKCIDVSGRFNEEGVFADPEFIISLARHFEAVLLYEPMAFHRLHDKSYTILNWEKSHDDGLAMIINYKKKGWLPAAVARKAIFKSHIHFGEKCGSYKKRKKAIHSFFKAWVTNPFSLVPLKKTMKLILQH